MNVIPLRAEVDFLDEYAQTNAAKNPATVGQIRVARECDMPLTACDQEATRWAIARALSKRLAFGF